MELVLIDKAELDAIKQQIAELKQLLLHKLPEPTPAQGKEWINLKEWMYLYGRSESSWYQNYRKKIKHSVADDVLTIHKPSMDKYLNDRARN